MTTLATPAVYCRTARYSSAISRDHRWWAEDCWRALIFCGLFSIIFLPEFARQGGDATGSFIYGKVAGGFRFVDLAVLALVLPHLVALACSRRRVVYFPRALMLPGIAFLACIFGGVLYGRAHGGTNLFFDWRGLALGSGLYLVWAFWMQNGPQVWGAVRLFAVYMAARMTLLLVLYLLGHRETLLGVPISIFDGPALSAIVFTGLLAFRGQAAAIGRRQKLLWTCLAAAAYMIVLLCFRRTYWAELAIGTGILLLLQRRNRVRSCLLAGMVVCVAAAVLGEAFPARLQSFDVLQMDNEFSADNSDHLNDLQDAWERVRESPLMGIGVGTSYTTWRIRDWKSESVMVHNAPIHVWLKYGIAGLICYLWFHAVLLWWLYKRSMTSNGVFMGAALAYVAAQFLTTLGFAPWPYSELQMTTLLSFILAAAFMDWRARACDAGLSRCQII